MRRTVSVLGTIILSVTCLGAERVAAQAAGPFVSEPVVPGSSPPVRDLPIARLPAPGDPIREFPRQQPPIPAPLRDVDAGQQVSDGALQTYYGPAHAPTAGGVTFDGIAQGDPGTGGVPPDPIGECERNLVGN